MMKKIIGLVFVSVFIFVISANLILATNSNPFPNVNSDLETKAKEVVENIKKKIPRIAIGLGEITAIDTSIGTFTAKNLKGIEMTFTVDSQSKIYKNGKLVSLSDLKVGDKGAGLITYRVEDSKNIVEKAWFKTNFANFAWGVGTITAVGTDYFTAKGLLGKEMTFYVNEQTKIYKNGKEAKLVDLKAGDKGVGVIKYKIEDDQNIAQVVRVKTNFANFAWGAGTITAITTDSFTVKNLQGKEMKFIVTSETKIYKNGKEAKLLDLKVGDKGVGVIKYKIEDDQNIAQVVRVKTNFANFAWGAGVITAITGDSFSVKNLKGKEMTFIVTSETKIYKNGKEFSLSELKVGDVGVGVIKYKIENGQNIAQTVRVKTQFANFTWGAGIITAIVGNSFTVKNQKGKEMTFITIEETKFYKDGKEGSLADLNLGDTGVGVIKYKIEDGKNIALVMRVKTKPSSTSGGSTGSGSNTPSSPSQ